MEILQEGNPKFDAVEELVIVSNVYVNGKLCKKGDSVKVKGNDKIQLLASKRGVRKAETPKGK